ncbi:MAG: hypothetical protein ACREQF_01830 [Candidatus Binataceae bacterium]
MTYQEATDYLEQNDLRVVILPERSGFVVFRSGTLSVVRALASGATFESTVEDARIAIDRERAAGTSDNGY